MTELYYNYNYLSQLYPIPERQKIKLFYNSTNLDHINTLELVGTSIGLHLHIMWKLYKLTLITLYAFIITATV